MSDPTENTDPIVVEITETGFDCFGDPTPRSKALSDVLVHVIGINKSMPPGRYNFNIIQVGTDFVISLVKIDEF